MLKIKRDINQQYFKIVHLHLHIFHPLEVVNRVSKAQLQECEKIIIFLLKG